MDDQLNEVRQVSANLESIPRGYQWEDALTMDTGSSCSPRRWLDQIRSRLDSPIATAALIVFAAQRRPGSCVFGLILYRSGSRVVAELEPICRPSRALAVRALARNRQKQLSNHTSRDGDCSAR